MYTEKHIVVTESALLRGKKYSRLWWSGWAVGVLGLVGGAFMSGQAIAYHRAMNEVAEARRDIQRIRQEQTEATETFIKAWNVQKRSIDLVTSWAQYIKDRDDMIAYNKNNPAVPFAQRR